MKKHLWLIFILILLIGCGPSGAEPEIEATQPPTTAAEPEIATAVPQTTTSDEPTVAPTQPAASDDLPTATFPATTIAEAAILRDSDWIDGASDPAITIIEYGDFQ